MSENIDSPSQNDFQAELQNSKEHLKFYWQNHLNTSDILPDFNVSEVIEKDQQIDARCEEDKPIYNFIIRMNQLGYEANVRHHTLFIDESNFSNPASSEDILPHIKLKRSQLNSDSSQVIVKYPIKKKDKQINRSVLVAMKMSIAELYFQHIQLLNQIHKMQQYYAQILSRASQQWQQQLCQYSNKLNQKLNHQKQKQKQLEEHIQMQMLKIVELQKMKQQMTAEFQNLNNKIIQLDEHNSRLIEQLEHIEYENGQLRFDNQTMQQSKKKCAHLELQNQELNLNLQQNSQYIFDLQQKVAGTNIYILERETLAKKQYAAALQQQKSKIQQEYLNQFQKIQDDLQMKLQEEIEQNYHQTLQNALTQFKRNAEKQKQMYSQQIQQLEQQNKKLESQIIKLNQTILVKAKYHQKNIKEFDPSLIQIKQEINAENYEISKLQKLQTKYDQLQQRFRDRQVQLNYYKDLVSKIQPNTRYTETKIANNYISGKKSICRQTAISPSSSTLNSQGFGHSRDDVINGILNRIKLRQGRSVISHLQDTSLSSIDMKKGNLKQSIIRPISPQSMLLEREKDVRIRNISQKLQHLKADIRRQIGIIEG